MLGLGRRSLPYLAGAGPQRQAAAWPGNRSLPGIARLRCGLARGSGILPHCGLQSVMHLGTHSRVRGKDRARHCSAIALCRCCRPAIARLAEALVLTPGPVPVIASSAPPAIRRQGYGKRPPGWRQGQRSDRYPALVLQVWCVSGARCACGRLPIRDRLSRPRHDAGRFAGNRHRSETGRRCPETG